MTFYPILKPGNLGGGYRLTKELQYEFNTLSIIDGKCLTAYAARVAGQDIRGAGYRDVSKMLKQNIVQTYEILMELGKKLTREEKALRKELSDLLTPIRRHTPVRR